MKLPMVRRGLLISCNLIVCTCAAVPSIRAQQQVHQVSLSSTVQWRYLLYLPPNYDSAPQAEFPLLLFPKISDCEEQFFK